MANIAQEGQRKRGLSLLSEHSIYRAGVPVKDTDNLFDIHSLGAGRGGEVST